MAIGLASATANAILDALLNGNAYAGNGTVCIQLHTGGPGPAGTAHVATENTRKNVAWGTPSGGTAQNTGTPTWGSVAATETITNFTLWTALTAGTFLASGQVSPALSLTAGQALTINAGDLTVDLNDAS